MIIGLFKETKITWQALANKLTKLFDQYGLRKIIIAYVKYERSNLYIMITTLKSIMRCELLGLDESFQGICFDHVFLKHVHMLLLMKMFLICRFVSNKSVYPIKFVKMYGLA
jgi:hypothetical protein